MLKLRPECQGHRAALYAFLRDEILPILEHDGVWIAPNPAPLNAEEVEAVFEAAAGLAHYSRQQLITRTDDHMMVTLLNGIVTIEPEPEAP
jgi:hypothetical protein